jgi:hypothetical protein
MSIVSELEWTAPSGAQVETPECVLFLDPVLGLVDVDFHRLTDEGWKNLAASTPSSAARLVVPASASVNAVRQAIGAIAEEGRYAKVLVAIGEP